LLYSIAAGPSGPEWDKFGHVERVKAYAHEGDMVKKWHVLYIANPYNLETNVSRSFMSAGKFAPLAHLNLSIALFISFILSMFYLSFDFACTPYFPRISFGYSS
jgi:hypothetical protein